MRAPRHATRRDPWPPPAPARRPANPATALSNTPGGNAHNIPVRWLPGTPGRTWLADTALTAYLDTCAAEDTAWTAALHATGHGHVPDAAAAARRHAWQQYKDALLGDPLTPTPPRDHPDYGPQWAGLEAEIGRRDEEEEGQ